MPEYLSPGVYIEEIPARLKAIEGVSTSTAGLVGAALRGPVAGLLPFVPAGGLALSPDPSPILVTSFAEYRRQFGDPPTDPVSDGYLGYAAHAFFDNGGKRAYVARVAGGGAAFAWLQVSQGALLRLQRRARAVDQTVYLDSLRGVDAGGATIQFFDKTGAAIGAALAVNAYDTLANSVTFPAAIGNDLDPEAVYAVPAAVAPSPGTGPIFWARSPGLWGGSLRVQIQNSDRPAVAITTAIAVATDHVSVRSTASFYKGALVEIDHGTNTTRDYFVVIDILPGNVLRLSANVNNVATTGFARVLEIDVILGDDATGTVETFRNLSWNGDPTPDIRKLHYSTVINGRSQLAFVQPPWAGLGGSNENPPTIDLQPMTVNAFPAGPLPANSGANGALPTAAEIVGVDGGPGHRTGIQSLQDVDDIRIIAAPGYTDPTVQNELITQAELMRYRFAVLDGERDPAPASPVNAILAHRNAYDTSYAAYYVPWVQIGQDDTALLLPPSGYIAGIYARVDDARGVWKAPANEDVRNITGLHSYITTGEQDILNPRGVNAIRRFEGRGIRVWGARTLSSDPEFRYVNVRRFLIFMEASIDRGTQWVVFENNSPETWSRVVDSVSAFLLTQWREGALFGRKPEDAFFVRCDETTMTVDDIQNGRLICQIGVAIVRPAEFVIFRIEQITGYSTAS